MIKNESFFHEHFYNAGIQKTGQLYKEQGRAKSWRELTEEYNLHVSSYMVWLSMIKSIPRTWKDILKHQENENDLLGLILLEGLEGTLYSKLSSKAIYKALVANVFQRPSAQDTIQKRTDRNIDWEKVYMIPRKCTIDSHARIFQYKILNNILYLNDRLFKMNLVESEMCSFYKGEKGTVEHLFLNCRIAKTLWTNICNLCKDQKCHFQCYRLRILFVDSQKVRSKIFVKTSFFFCLKSSYINKEVDSPGQTSKVSVTVFTQYTESNTKLRLQTTNLTVILRSGSILSLCFPQEEQQLHQTEYFNVVKK